MSFASGSLIQRGWVQEVEANPFETSSNEVKPIETLRRYKHYADNLRGEITPARKRPTGSALVSPHILKDGLKQIRTIDADLKNDKVVAGVRQSEVKVVSSSNKAITKEKASSLGLGYEKYFHKIPPSISKAPDLLTIKWGTPFYGERLGPYKMNKDGYAIENVAITPVDTAAWVHDDEYKSIYNKYNLDGDATPLDWAEKVTSTNHLFQIDSIHADARLIGNSWSNMIEGLSKGFYNSKEGSKTFSTDLAWATAITTSHSVLIGMRALSAGIGFISSTISGVLTTLAGAAEQNYGLVGKGIGYVLRGVDKVLSAAVGVTQAVIGVIGGAAMAVVGAAGLVAGYIAGKTVEFGAAIVNAVGGFAKDVGNAISSGAKAVGDFIGGAVGAVGDFFDGIGEAIGNGINAVGDFFVGGESEASVKDGGHQQSSDQDHDTGGEVREGGKGGGWCFITGATLTSIGGADSRYELELLRTFRDTYVINRNKGIFLIREYYVVAKDIVLKINQEANSQAVYKGIYDQYLQHAVDAIERRHYLRALKLYEGMVNDLSYRYGVSKPTRLPIEPINRYTALAA